MGATVILPRRYTCDDLEPNIAQGVHHQRSAMHDSWNTTGSSIATYQAPITLQ